MELQRNGFFVLMVAPEQTDTPLQTRVRRANEGGSDAYISIHANAYGTGWNDANGIESWIYEKVAGGSKTEQFATAVHKELILATGLNNRGFKRSADLYVLRNTKMHAVLVECGFMTNMEEAKLLRNDTYRKRCAEAICRGVCKFYGKKYKEDIVMPKEKEACPGWKMQGEKALREMELTTSEHNPLEVVDFGTLGVILKNVMNKIDKKIK